MADNGDKMAAGFRVVPGVRGSSRRGYNQIGRLRKPVVPKLFRAILLWSSRHQPIPPVVSGYL